MSGPHCFNIPHKWGLWLGPDATGEFLLCSRCGKSSFINKRQSNKLHRWLRDGTRMSQIELREEKP